MTKIREVVFLQCSEVTECQVEAHKAGQLRLRAEAG